MCGLAGIINFKSSHQALDKKLENMKSSMFHRGPDDKGRYIDADAPIALGHRRLAIIDPKHGKQPMTTEDGLLTIVFNGAVYNYLELRRQLIQHGHPIRSYSDTEVLLYAYRHWGEDCVDHLLGMFAFAIWDKKNQKLFCARDRVGIKPFYYFFKEDQFVFASEIKAILAEGTLRAESNHQGLQDYVTFQFCLGEKTLFKDIVKLQPGHCLTVELGQERLSLKVRQYWDVVYDMDTTHDEAWFVDNLAVLIEDAVSMHLRSDVPLGAHLSGGLDSSVVVSHAANLLRGERLKTFTGAFHHGPQFDETAYARLVAEASNVQYNDIYIPEEEFSTILPRLMYMMDEPVAGPGLIPQYFVSKKAAEQVKVVLGGQGGDEIFIGYSRYMVAYLEKALLGAIDETTSQSQYAVSLESLVPNLALLKTYKPMLKAFWSNGLFDSQDKRYFNLVDRSAQMKSVISSDLLNNNYSPFASFQAIFNREGVNSLINQMTYFDLKASLPALLHVEDRTSMAASIESRVPLLDHRIIEFMARIPPNIKFSGGRMKHLFKEAVQNTVPAPILARKDKMGFPTPLTQWVNGSGKEFVKDTLLSSSARQRGLYHMEHIESAIKNEQEFGRVVWGLLCLELWHKTYIDGDYTQYV
jgi:asparagine synthase (glutamine-hydrolysing)